MEKNKNKIVIGCVADDFTGASDAASFLQKEGIKTLLSNGIPDINIDDKVEYNAIVIALKTRSIEKEKAVEESMEAFEWLKDKGAEHLYSKYCSTFDSTREGNIGPIIDSALEEYGVKYTIICPALPVNGRVVKDGCLYIDGVPLDETHMKDHPLNPMWDCDLVNLIEAQGKYKALKINHKQLKLPKTEILNIIEEFGKDKEHFYIVPDYTSEEDAKKIAEVFGDDYLLTGGSGILSQLGKRYNKNLKSGEEPITNENVSGKGIVLAGSSSKATLEQIEDFQSKGGRAFKMDPLKLINKEISVEDIWNFIEESDEDVLIYSSDTVENIKKAQKAGKELVSHTLESATAEIARRAINSGIKRIIVAGGETSGAVTKELGYNTYLIGDSIAPGVPIMVPLEDTETRLVLKSGNFGQVDFFSRALEETRGD